MAGSWDDFIALRGVRLCFEHELLRLLAAAGLSFALPVPIPTRAGADSATIPLEDRETAPATLTPLIPGEPPDRSDLAQARAAGEALALLDAALAQGYKRHVALAANEIEAIPVLFAFRAYTSLIHRLGRYRQGLRTEQTVGIAIDVAALGVVDYAVC